MLAQDGRLIDYCNRGRTDRAHIGTLGPSRSLAIGAAIEFPPDLKYPYTFSMLAAALEPGDGEDGHFAVQIFTQGPSAKTRRLN